jgi:glycine dehydrogenase subunit 2
MRSTKPLIFEISHTGRRCTEFPTCRQSVENDIDSAFLRTAAPKLPEIAEVDLIRHYTGLSKRAHGVDSGFYPLGSCTMKYNPKVNEDVARLPGFTDIHPLQSEETAQGNLEVLYTMQNWLSEITGMAAFTLQPAAGAHGEWTGMSMIKAYHTNRGDSKRTKVLVPDSAHGTNPASAALAGFEVVQIASAPDGGVDIDALTKAADGTTAALMLTNPSTLGLFETRITEVAQIVHDAGGLLYYDGANLNAIMGVTRPGDMGFDVMHLNLHKTFSTPHGGGGPGSGPVGCSKILEPFLPAPVVVQKADGAYMLDDARPYSIGRVRSFHGNFGVIVRAMTYIMSLGAEGLLNASMTAVLNANYMKDKLRDTYTIPYDRACMHEFVLSAEKIKANTGCSAMDVAKKLLDYGMHPPTMYFPLIVHEALMIEPTETESLETLDFAINALVEIAGLAQSSPEELHAAPVTTPVGRLDEVAAARKPKLRWVPK